jgi:hypothetical protein
MANNGGCGSTGVVALVINFIIVVAVAVFAFRARIFSGNSGGTNIKVITPQR